MPQKLLQRGVAMKVSNSWPHSKVLSNGWLKIRNKQVDDDVTIKLISRTYAYVYFLDISDSSHHIPQQTWAIQRNLISTLFNQGD